VPVNCSSARADDPSVMKISASQFGRALTQWAIGQTIRATARLSVEQQRRTIRSLAEFAGVAPPLRRRVRVNMGLALGSAVATQSENLYFRRLGWFLSNALSTFHHGLGSTSLPDDVKFDESVQLLDDAVSQGRGVVIVSPHWSGHELVAAVVNRRHPVVGLVRQAPTAERMERKLKWYSALGTEIVFRPTHASTIKDAATYLNVLKRRKMLWITPDLLADPGQGVAVQIFGRPARLHGGAFAIAMAARSPMLRSYFSWQSDTRVIVRWANVAMPRDTGDRDAAIRTAVQDWCLWFEDKLRANPENWLFWLDKRWSRFLRDSSGVSGLG
jgi:lauroyl/myristoyl acyltransferase